VFNCVTYTFFIQFKSHLLFFSLVEEYLGSYLGHILLHLPSQGCLYHMDEENIRRYFHCTFGRYVHNNDTSCEGRCWYKFTDEGERRRLFTVFPPQTCFLVFYLFYCFFCFTFSIVSKYQSTFFLTVKGRKSYKLAEKSNF
jgi:hypothetical protein